jgi:hypothetical protein
MFAFNEAPAIGSADDEDDNVERAIAAIQRLGGTVRRRDTSADGYVRAKSVQMAFKKITDADLVHLSVLKGLIYLYPTATQVTDEGLARLEGLRGLTTAAVEAR